MEVQSTVLPIETTHLGYSEPKTMLIDIKYET